MKQVIPSAFERKDGQATTAALRRLFMLAIAEHTPEVIEDLFRRCFELYRPIQEFSDKWSDVFPPEQLPDEIVDARNKWTSAIYEWAEVGKLREDWIIQHAEIASCSASQKSLDPITAWRNAAEAFTFTSYLNSVAPEASQLNWLMPKTDRPQPPRTLLPLPHNKKTGDIFALQEYLKVVEETAKRFYEEYVQYLESTHGFTSVPAVREYEEHVKWLVIYQCRKNVSLSSVVKGKGKPPDKKTVSEAIKKMAARIGLKLRSPSRGGPKAKSNERG